MFLYFYIITHHADDKVLNTICVLVHHVHHVHPPPDYDL